MPANDHNPPDSYSFDYAGAVDRLFGIPVVENPNIPEDILVFIDQAAIKMGLSPEDRSSCRDRIILAHNAHNHMHVFLGKPSRWQRFKRWLRKLVRRG